MLEGVSLMTENIEEKLVLTKSLYKEIFMEYYKPLCLFVRKVVTREADAEDLVHNVFLVIWEKKMAFHNKRALKAYLFQAVYNQALTHVRRQSFTIPLQEHDQNEESDESNYLRIRIESEMFLEIMQAIEQLPEHRREIFKLSYVDGLKISEVAERLDIAEETVKSQRLKARKQLQEALKDLYPLCWLIFFSDIC